ncbi:MAG: class I SAM-dependent methyltransferase [bacterium]
MEFRRTLDIVKRYLPSRPATILDLGGGTGLYTFRLANEGHVVDLIDAMPNHIETARVNPHADKVRRIDVGDARKLDYEPACFDAALLMGPLYHLIDFEDRLTALKEVRRVLKPGGVVFAAAISKYASLLDGYFGGLIEDPVFQEIVDQDLLDGQHRNPGNHPHYFTTAKFHTPTELAHELTTAGFGSVMTKGVEGFGWLVPNFGKFEAEQMHRLMEYLRKIEDEAEIKGVSAHLLGIGIKLD